MGELGREALFSAHARRQPVEERVERGGQLGQLVVRLAEAKAAVEVALAPRGRFGGHPRHRPQGGGQRPARREQDDQQQRRAEAERVDEGGSPALVVGRERDTRHDRSDSTFAVEDRQDIEPHVRAASVDEALSSFCETPRLVTVGQRYQVSRPWPDGEEKFVDFV